MFAMGFAPEVMKGADRNSLKNLFLEKRNNYTALMFVQKRNMVRTYRRVVRKLMAHDHAAIALLDEIYGPGGFGDENDGRGIYGNRAKTEEITKKLSTFWDKYGKQLSPKLNMVQDRTIPAKMDRDSDFRDYYKIVHTQQTDQKWVEDYNHFQDGEHGYDYVGGAPPALETLMGGWIKIGGTNGNMSEKTYTAFWKTIVLPMLRDLKDPTKYNIFPTAAENEAFRRKTFAEYRDVIVHAINSDTVNVRTIMKQNYIKDLLELGFEPSLFYRDEERVVILREDAIRRGRDPEAAVEEWRVKGIADKAQGKGDVATDDETIDREFARFVGSEQVAHAESTAAEQQRTKYETIGATTLVKEKVQRDIDRIQKQRAPRTAPSYSRSFSPGF